ncbi:hypothetical protein J6Y73_00800 [bacterium]|nr:hypothetical protein [bacterium]
MAKYAQGYERKKSDTRNLIFLAAAIVLTIAVAIAIVAIVNNVRDYSTHNLTVAPYTEYEIPTSSYSASGLRNVARSEKSDYNYFIYVYSANNDNSNSKVMEYIDKYIASKDETDNSKKLTTPMYILDYDKFDNAEQDSESDEAKYKDELAGAFGLEVIPGYLIFMKNGEVTSTQNQIVTKDVNSVIQKLIDGGAQEIFDFTK